MAPVLNEERNSNFETTTAHSRQEAAVVVDNERSMPKLVSSIQSFENGSLRKNRNVRKATNALESVVENATSVASFVAHENAATCSYENKDQLLKQIQSFQKDNLKTVTGEKETKSKPAPRNMINSNLMDALRNMNLDIYGKNNDKIYGDDFN